MNTATGLIVGDRSIELVNHRRVPPGDRTWQPPFDWSVVYENEDWWGDILCHDPDPWFVQVKQNGVEVARIQLVGEFDGELDHIHAPTMGSERLTIHLFEVSVAARGRGIGTQALASLTELHPNRRFVAHSEEADRFWQSLGWHRYEHPDGAAAQRPLFVQPRGR